MKEVMNAGNVIFIALQNFAGLPCPIVCMYTHSGKVFQTTGLEKTVE